MHAKFQNFGIFTIEVCIVPSCYFVLRYTGAFQTLIISFSIGCVLNLQHRIEIASFNIWVRHIINKMELEHRLSALLQLHLHSRLNYLASIAWANTTARRGEARDIEVWWFGASYIRDFTVGISSREYVHSTGSGNTPFTPINLYIFSVYMIYHVMVNIA